MQWSILRRTTINTNELLAIDGFNIELVDKYNEYVRKRQRQARTGRTARKDSTKTKVYRAEWNFQAQCGDGIVFADLKEAQKYCDRIVKSKTYQDLNGREAYVVGKKNMGNRSVFSGMAYSGGKIQLCPGTGFNQYTLLHELAHQCGHWHHDIAFRKCLLRLVSRFMGRDKAKALKEEFKKVGLKMSQRTSIKSPEQWLKDYFKMQALRELHSAGGV